MPWNAPAMKVVRFEKPMLWSRGKRMLATRCVALNKLYETMTAYGR
jgi:hypothetical protein